MIARRISLFTGLYLFAFVFAHLINLALGLDSVSTMDQARGWLLSPWTNPIGGGLLMVCLVFHICLGLRSLYLRNTLRLNAFDAFQLLLGLSIPLLLFPHMITMAAVPQLTGVHSTYEQVLAHFWIDNPWLGLRQIIGLMVVWLHSCMGLFIWMRLQGWWSKVSLFVYPTVVLLPTLAMLGFVEAGKEVIAAKESTPSSYQSSSYGADYGGSDSSGSGYNYGSGSRTYGEKQSDNYGRSDSSNDSDSYTGSYGGNDSDAYTGSYGGNDSDAYTGAYGDNDNDDAYGSSYSRSYGGSYSSSDGGSYSDSTDTDSSEGTAYGSSGYGAYSSGEQSESSTLAASGPLQIADRLVRISVYGYLLLLVLALLARAVRLYPSGKDAIVQIGGASDVKVPGGATLLEVSRLNDVPHASLCGGKGRCGTCQVAIVSGAENLTAITAIESGKLRQIQAADNIRLACQARVTGGRIEVNPVLPGYVVAEDMPHRRAAASTETTELRGEEPGEVQAGLHREPLSVSEDQS